MTIQKSSNSYTLSGGLLRLAMSDSQKIHYVLPPTEKQLRSIQPGCSEQSTAQVISYNPETYIRHTYLLGVRIDSQLKWHTHVRRSGGDDQIDPRILAKIITFTWGATFSTAWHVYRRR